MDTAGNAVYLFFERLINLIALWIDLFRAGRWVAAIVAFVLLLLLIAAVMYAGAQLAIRRYKRKNGA